MLDTVSAITDYIRQLISVFDYVAYFFLSFTYQLFYNIVNFNFLDGEMIFSLFSRIQLIIGVFMMFQLAITILKGIINPDTFTDSKTGAGNLVMRIAVSLTLLAMLVPINIPNPHNEYEKQINNSGILFGTLYSLQHRILKNNTIGKLIFGNDDTDYTSSNPDDSLFVAGNQFSTTLVKSFYVLNVDDNGDFVCPSEEDDYVDNYNNTDENYANIIYLATAKCNSNGDVNGILSVVGMAATATGHLEVSIPLGIASYFTGEEAYVVMIVPFLSTLAAVVIAILLIMMSFEVAVRALKLMSLQLMAPIPIISYMDPKGGKDGAFNSWVKLLSSTYLELFVRLAVIYLVMDIISMLTKKIPDLLAETVSSGDNLVVNIFIVRFTVIILIIALLIFAKNAPKFFKQMLGIKDNGGKFFSAFGDAIGIGATAVGALGSINANRQASFDADVAHAKERGATDAQAHAYAMRGANRAKHALAGLFGGVMGVATGSAAASESKGNGLAKLMASANAMNKRNEKVRAAGRDGGTFFGGARSLGQELVYGQNEYDMMEAENKAEEQRIKNEQARLKTDQDALKTLQNNTSLIEKAKKRADSKALSNTVTRAHIKDLIGVSGTRYNIAGINAEAYNSSYQSAKDQGKSFFEVTDDTGAKITINMDDGAMIQRQVVDGNSANYYDRTVLFEKWFDRVYEQNINSGMTEDAARKDAVTKAEAHGGINDTTILSARQSYRDANEGHDMASTYEKHHGRDGIKIQMGDNNNEIDRISNELARKSQELSARSQAVNDRRQSAEALRTKSNAERFKK